MGPLLRLHVATLAAVVCVCVLLLSLPVQCQSQQSQGTRDIEEAEEAVCKLMDLPLFQYSKCELGNIGIGPDCKCDQHECRLAYTRQYMPPKQSLQQQLSVLKRCGRPLGRRLLHYILSNAKKIPGRGYPVDVDCAKMEAWTEASIEQKVPNLCSRSLGKFLRYISLLVYTEFDEFASQQAKAGRRAGDRDSGSSRSSSSSGLADAFTLLDIHYPQSWRAIKGIPACHSADAASNGWTCLFKSVSDLSDLSNYAADVAADAATEAAADETVVPDVLVKEAFLRLVDSRNEEDDIVQVLLYGLLLSAISRPSALVDKFSHEHIVNDEYTELEKYLSSQGLTGQGSQAGPEGDRYSVSMHVRHGDSCDYYVLEEAEYYKYKYLNGPKYARPCFSIDMYLQKLREVHEKYGVSTVYLATDSSAMIARTKLEPGFKWVYLDFPRDVFDYSGGWVDYYPESILETVSVSAAADLDLLKRGDIFIGK
jgi:hypothetical protein